MRECDLRDAHRGKSRRDLHREPDIRGKQLPKCVLALLDPLTQAGASTAVGAGARVRGEPSQPGRELLEVVDRYLDRRDIRPRFVRQGHAPQRVEPEPERKEQVSQVVPEARGNRAGEREAFEITHAVVRLAQLARATGKLGGRRFALVCGLGGAWTRHLDGRRDHPRRAPGRVENRNAADAQL